MFQPPNTTDLPSIIIITYLGGEYPGFYHIIGLVGTAANVQNPTCNVAAYMQTPSNRATAYYNFIPTNNFYLE